MNNSKITELSKLEPTLLKAMSRKVLVGGCFDIFHFGHLQFLKTSAQEGDNLIIALESDEFIKKNKKREPYHNLAQRALLLAELECVRLVVTLPLLSKYEEYLKVVKLIKPEVLIVTKGDDQLKNKEKQASIVGASVKVVPLLPKFSSTHVYAYATISSD